MHDYDIVTLALCHYFYYYLLHISYLSCAGNYILSITHCILACAIHYAYIRGTKILISLTEPALQRKAYILPNLERMCSGGKEPISGT